MHRSLTILLIFTLLLSGILAESSNSHYPDHSNIVGTANQLSSKSLIVDINGTQDHTSIQAAVDAAVSGTTISVWAGTFHENIHIDKNLTLIGNGSSETYVDGGGTGNVITVRSSWIDISGFTIRDSGSMHSGIDLGEVSYSNIADCVLANNKFGIYAAGNGKCDNNNIFKNEFHHNTKAGLWLIGNDNKISSNHFTSNDCAITVDGDNNTINNNTVKGGNNKGIILGNLQHQVLMMGNSYTYGNSLDQIVESVLKNDMPNAIGHRLTNGGLTLDDHANRAQSSGHTWNTTLNNGSKWNWVILQDQSQIPGFPTTDPNWQASKAAAKVLNNMIRDAGADTVFLMTWGRRDGDTMNPGRYPNFTVMQMHLENGYNWYAENISTSQRQVYIAPCGLAFKQIHDEIVAKGQDPTASGSLFYNLYTSDGSHPSLAGSYLAACVIYATLTGFSPIGLNDDTALNASYRLKLQGTAHATVFNETPDYLYPWENGRTVKFASNIIIRNNSIMDCAGLAVSILEARDNNNSVHHNEFFKNNNNEVQALDHGKDNSWDDGFEGNYWSDYEFKYPSATNNTLVWDTPYQILGGAGSTDNYPLVSSFTIPDHTPPIAEAGSDQTVYQGTMVWFNGTGSSDNIGIVNFTWNFTYNESEVYLFSLSPGFYFITSGNYHVTLTVTDDYGNSVQDIVIITVLVFIPPDLTPPVPTPGNVMNQSIENGTQVYFNAGSWTDPESSITNYTWTFWFNSTLQLLDSYSNSFIFDISGNYTVVLNVTNEANLSSLWVFWINVYNDTVPPVAFAGDDLVVDQYDLVTFDGHGSFDNKNLIVNYTWFIDHIYLYGITVHFTFHEADMFIVTLNVTDIHGNWDSDSLNVSVRDITAPIANAGVNITIGQRSQVVFNASGSTDNAGIVDYNWTVLDLENISFLHGAFPNYRFDHAGEFLVILLVADEEGNNASDTITITVLDIEPPLAQAATSNNIVLVGAIVVLNGSGSTDNVGIVNWTWTIGNNTIYGEVVLYSFYKPGFITVILTVYDAHGNSANKVLNITIELESEPPTVDDDVFSVGIVVVIIAVIVIILVVIFAFILLVKKRMKKEEPVEESGNTIVEKQTDDLVDTETNSLAPVEEMPKEGKTLK